MYIYIGGERERERERAVDGFGADDLCVYDLIFRSVLSERERERERLASVFGSTGVEVAGYFYHKYLYSDFVQCLKRKERQV